MNISILYIEDDIEDIEIFSELLKESGIDPARYLESANTIKEAKDILHKKEFDIIFLDLNLPDSNGIVTYHKITSEFSKIPIIAMTGLNDLELSSDLVRNGAQDYLVKGEFDGKFLKRVILYAIERKKLDIALRNSEEKHRALFEYAPENVVLVDKNRIILDCNINFLKMLEYNKEEVIGKHLKEFTADSDLEKCITAFNKLETVPNSEVELNLKKKSGQEITVWRTINALFDKEGNFDGAIIHSRDFTDRKQYESRLQKQREHIQLINKILRHDLTNNLTAIKAHLKLFGYDNDMQNIIGSEEYLNKSILLIKRMKELEAFLDSNTELNLFNVDRVIANAAEKYKQLSISITGRNQILADHAIDSIFDNIFGNAIKHGKAKNINVTIQDHNNMCMVRVCDDGVGIEDEFKDKVFEENFANKKTGGTGLGLYIVNKTMQRYGGYVFTEDNEPKGVCFVLMFKKM